MKIPWLDQMKGRKEKLAACKPILLVLSVGILLLLLPTGGKGALPEGPQAVSQSDPFDLEAFEDKLEQVLSQVSGAGEVRVVLTLDSGSRQVLAQDQKLDGDGGGTASTVTLGRGSDSQEVIPLQTFAPSFRGALVVCSGGEDPQVRLKLVEAVSALTGLGADRISVCGGGQG